MLNDRLAIVCEIVRAAQSMRRIGVSRTGYAKILRETVFFVWELQDGTKFGSARLRSRAAKSASTADLEYDHAVPLKLAIDKLLAGPTDPATVGKVLSEWVLGCAITRAEHERLQQIGLQSSMPANWDGRDKFARYKAAGIEF